MAPDRAKTEEWEERIRDALGKEFSRHKELEGVKEWRSHHALFYHFTLAKKGKRKQNLVTKYFVPPQGEDQASMYGFLHAPDFLFRRELANTQLIIDNVGEVYGRNFSRKLVPHIFGSSEKYRTLVMQHLAGSNKKQELLRMREEESASAVDQSFMEGIKAVSRFDGAVNACREAFDAKYDYRNDAVLFKGVAQHLLLENIARVVYQLNTDCHHAVGEEFNLSKVLDYITGEIHLDLEAKLLEIKSLQSTLHTEEKLQHRDCNGLNQVGTTLLDLEDFGYAPWTDDISSYCTVVGMGNNTIIKSQDFPHFILAYLALEHAYEHKDEEKIRKLEKATNGEFKDYVGSIMNMQSYSHFLMGFFDLTLEKNVQLGATFSRYILQQQTASGSATGTSKETIEELFETITSLDKYIRACERPEEIRELFYKKAELYNGLGITAIPARRLEEIRSGTTGGRLDFTSPTFK